MTLRSWLSLACLVCAIAACDSSNKIHRSGGRPSEIAGPTILPDRGAILPASMARELALRCSAVAPGAIDNVWTPTADQIAKLEPALADEILDELNGAIGGSNGVVPSDYYRQYVGLIMRGQHIIFINGFRLSELPPPSTDWHTTPVMKCNGGPAYFAGEYDVETASFRNFEFSGYD